MPISQVRIDDRLIHGQVVEGWLKPLSIKQVLVVSDAAAKDEMQATLMKLAATEGVEVTILSVVDSTEWLKKHRVSTVNIMVLAPSLNEISKLIEGGVKLEAIHVGGLHHPEYKLEVSSSIRLSERDCAILKELSNRGVRVEAQTIPTEAAQDLLALVAKS